MNALLSFATGVASPVIPCWSAEVIRSHTRRSRYRGPQSPITSSAKSCGAQARADIVSSLTNHKEVGQGVTLIHQCGHVRLSPAREARLTCNPVVEAGQTTLRPGRINNSPGHEPSSVLGGPASVVSRDVSSHLRGVQGQGGIGSQLVIGGHDVAAQPGINLLLAGEQLPESIADDLAAVGVSARGNPLLQLLRQMTRQSDAQLPTHKMPPLSLNRKNSTPAC